MSDKENKIPEETIQKYMKKWIAIGTNTDKCDFLACVEGAKEAYAAIRASRKADEETLPVPTIFIGPVNNPVEAAYAESRLPYAYEVACKELGIPHDEKDIPADDDKIWQKISSRMNQILLAEVEVQVVGQHKILGSNYRLPAGVSVAGQLYGGGDASWLAYYDLWEHEPGIDPKLKEIGKRMSGLCKIAQNGGWWVPAGKAIIFQHRPRIFSLDAQNRLHNFTGPAWGFYGYDGFDIYYVHNVAVTRNIIERKYTWQDIDKETNAEVRRIMIQLYKVKPGEEETDRGGASRYLQDSGCVEVARDDWGTIYRKDIPDDEPVFCVKVVNSTQEKDGTYKDYWIRFDPSQYNGDAGKIPRAAIASFHRNKKDNSLVFEDWRDYSPLIQT